MQRFAIVAAVLLLSTAVCMAGSETVQQLRARAEAAKPDDRPGLYIEIAERQLKAADQLFASGKDEEAQQAIKDVMTYSEKAHDAAVDAHNKFKNTEIALRKMAVKLRDVKRTLSFDQQEPVQAAADRLETLRSDLLSYMFGKRK